jgi:hypothetical protein
VSSTNTPQNLDDLIEKEKKALAREYFSEIWADIKIENLETELIAEVFVQEALERLADENGLEKASKLITYFKDMDELGVLPVQRTLQ